MPAYLVTIDRTKSGHTLKEGGDAMVVFASTGAIAKEMAAARYDGDGTAWATDGTATEIVAASIWDGWTFALSILGGLGTGNDEAATFTVVGNGTTLDTIDEIGAALVVLLNAHADIAGAAYDTTTQVLKVAETTDGLGDQAIQLHITPPSGHSPIAGLVGTIVDEGASGDVLSVVLPADAAVIPKTLAVVQQV